MNIPEYNILKRLCFAIKEVSTDFTGAEANMLISESCQRAFDSLDERDRVHVQAAVYALEKGVNRKGFSQQGALEVLASVAQVMEE